MSEQQQFEQWAAERLGFRNFTRHADGGYFIERIEDTWQAWQAARAQGGQGAGPVAWPCWSCKSMVSMNGRSEADGDCPNCGAELDLELWPAQPPAKPESVPEGWTLIPSAITPEMWDAANAAYQSPAAIFRALLDAAPEPPNTTPRPAGDGSIKCSDRLPTEADEDICGQVWGWVETKGVGKWFRMSATETRDMSGNRAGPICTHWKPTGLKRPQPPKQEQQK